MHIRPPSNHTPIAQLVYDRDVVLQGAVNDLVNALKRLGKTKRGQNLGELSVQCLPVQVRFPGLYDDEDPDMVAKAMRKLRLKTLKIGLVVSTVWNRDPNLVSPSTLLPSCF